MRQPKEGVPWGTSLQKSQVLDFATEKDFRRGQCETEGLILKHFNIYLNTSLVGRKALRELMIHTQEPVRGLLRVLAMCLSSSQVTTSHL